MGVGAAAAALADFAAQRLVEAQLRQRGRHDVGHHLVPRHGRDDRRRRVAEAQHAVAAVVVDHRAFQRDHPGSTRGQRDVGVDGVVRIEIDETSLRARDLLGLVQRQELGHLLLQLRELGGGFVHGDAQIGIVGEGAQAGFVQSVAVRAAAGAAQRSESGQQIHGVLPRDQTPARRVKMR